MPRILAFDIGIKNLAWCCIDLSGSPAIIRGWANENLLTGGTAETDAETNRCETCSHKAAYWLKSNGNGYCVRHCPPLTPALRDCSGNLLRKIPKIDVLRDLCKRGDASKTDTKTKAAMITFLETRYCFPKPPAPSVGRVDLEQLHDGIRRVIERNKILFGSCWEILLENQPVYKNPVMKSVQMMLFATLRDVLQPAPPKLRLVHAGRKTVGATKGDEGYAERKGASESRVADRLRSGSLRMGCADNRAASWFSEQAKRSDLADCCCMCLDAGDPKEKEDPKDAKKSEKQEKEKIPKPVKKGRRGIPVVDPFDFESA